MLRIGWIIGSFVAAIYTTLDPGYNLFRFARTRRAPRWGLVAVLAAAAYFALAYWCHTAIDSGAPGWLNVIVLYSVFDGLMLLGLGPASLIWLIKSRLHDRRAARHSARENEVRNVQPQI